MDAKSYFSLPNDEEREEIFRIHINRTGKVYDEGLLSEAAKCTINYTGAEIKEVVKVSLRKAFVRFKQDGVNAIMLDDIKAAAKEVIPLYLSSREKILALESYATGRARFSRDEQNCNLHTSSQNDGLINDLLIQGGLTL